MTGGSWSWSSMRCQRAGACLACWTSMASMAALALGAASILQGVAGATSHGNLSTTIWPGQPRSPNLGFVTPLDTAAGAIHALLASADSGSSATHQVVGANVVRPRRDLEKAIACSLFRLIERHLMMVDALPSIRPHADA
ncbi:uncharacterized protein B0I36DRAFT_405963 [Microdochium trichocladiopsis]|uniref:Uncharacterized protein n=1 Tax=Microdochium trichocladiopsis TaxID=1682393 RepID=A0A9P9BR00_9PEZI|nr:uncharacterized protein B0I36DRAFT_405963 [Microdochium trichocladiopsis]KAH7035428.1 hypothetical protein B0I36DRAFT_405963 [Microdochium trichocladiopsis]